MADREEPGSGRPHGIMSTMTLYEGIKAGDSRSRELFFLRIQPRLANWASGRLSIKARLLQETGDVVNTVIIRVLSNLDNFDPQHRGSIYLYLRKAIMSGIIDALRKKVPDQEEFEPEGHVIDQQSPLDVLIERETYEQFEAALETLTIEEPMVWLGSDASRLYTLSLASSRSH